MTSALGFPPSGHLAQGKGINIPEWYMVSLGELEQRGSIELFRGKVISQKDINRLPGEFPIYSSSVNAAGLFGSFGKYMFDEELITWSIDGGGHFFHRPKHRYSVTNVCGYMRVRTPSIDARYLAYQLQQLHSRKVFDYSLKAHPSVIRGAYTIPLPPTNEQHAIAEALSDVDGLLGVLDALIAKRREIKQATMQKLLSGETRLPGFNGEWETKRLAEVCALKSGASITAARIDGYSAYPCYGGNGLRGFTSTFTHDGDHALIGRQGALCGNVVGVSRKFYASEHALVVTPLRSTDIHWLTFVLGRMHLNQYSESSAQPGLSAAKLLLLEIACPPTKAEQSAIAVVLSDIDAELVALETRRDKTRAIKQGMMQQLLTGRVRLVNPAPADAIA